MLGLLTFLMSMMLASVHQELNERHHEENVAGPHTCKKTAQWAERSS